MAKQERDTRSIWKGQERLRKIDDIPSVLRPDISIDQIRVGCGVHSRIEPSSLRAEKSLALFLASTSETVRLGLVEQHLLPPNHVVLHRFQAPLSRLFPSRHRCHRTQSHCSRIGQPHSLARPLGDFFFSCFSTFGAYQFVSLLLVSRIFHRRLQPSSRFHIILSPFLSSHFPLC